MDIAIKVLRKAERVASEFQIWPNYYKSKTREYTTITKLFKIKDITSVLEIGCGNGFVSAILSKIAKSVVALDLPDKEPDTHSIGIDVAGRFIKKMDVKNVRIVTGNSESLAFESNSFDLVYSAFTFQYIKNKDKALQEVYRVLKHGGKAILLLPNFVGRIKNLFILKPDGAYRNIIEELASYTAISWRKLFEKNDFKMISKFSTEIVPFSLFRFGMFSNLAYRINDKLCNFPVIKNFGFSIVFVLEK